MKSTCKTENAVSFELLVERSYTEYRSGIQTYIANRINHRYDAEDLAQDVFMRLLDYKQMVRPDTVKYFLFTIARNLVTDHIRRYYKKQEIDMYAYDVMSHSTNETEETCHANDLALLEQKKLKTFAPQRKTVYTLSRFEENSIGEIAQKMNLSPRTVENHLLLGRKEMRNYIRQCI